MRLTIDNPQSPEDYSNSVQAFMIVRAENPDQQIGNGGAIPLDMDGTTYLVVRNEDSYTVRVGGSQEELGMEGFPV